MAVESSKPKAGLEQQCSKVAEKENPKLKQPHRLEMGITTMASGSLQPRWLLDKGCMKTRKGGSRDEHTLRSFHSSPT